MPEQKRVVITGGSRGIGAALVRAFYMEADYVSFSYRSDEESAKKVISSLWDTDRLFAFQCDVADPSSCEDFVKRSAEAMGGIDVLVNNAGIAKDGLIMRMSEQSFDDVLDTNLKGAFNMIKYVSPLMMKQRFGRIINMSSVVGIGGNAGQANYAASKAGLIGLTKAAAKELGSRGVTVNAIAPGFIETDMTSALPDGAKTKMLEHIAAGRPGNGADVAALAVFLASEQASYITGEVIRVDGGMSI